MRVGVIIPAAGQSRRFGDLDKLAQDLGGRAVLLRTVELFTKRDDVVAIVIAGPPDDLENFKTRYGPALSRAHDLRDGAKCGHRDSWSIARKAGG